MKKAAAFVLGLVAIPTLLILWILMIVPLMALITLPLAVVVSGIAYKWLFGDKPVEVLTAAGPVQPTEADFQAYAANKLGIKLCFALGLMTS